MEMENETPIPSCILWKLFKTLYSTQLCKIKTLSYHDNVMGHTLVIREWYKFRFVPCESDVYDTIMYKGSCDCHCSQICPNQPFGATPRPSKAPAQTPNPLDSATSSKKSVVPVEPMPLSLSLCKSQSTALVPM